MSRREIFTIASRAQAAPQILRAHLTEPGDHAFQLTAYAAIGRLGPGKFFLEPSRNAIIMEVPGVGIQVSDWMRNRTVEIATPGPVRTVPRVLSIMCSDVITREPLLVYVWW